MGLQGRRDIQPQSLGLYGDSGKEHGNFYIIRGFDYGVYLS